MSSDAFSEASLTKNVRCWTPLGRITAPPSPLAGLRARELGKEGRVREKKGWDEREKEEGEEREGDTVSQLQFLDQPW